MSIYKKLTPSDVTRVPFNANKLQSFDSSSASSVGISLQTFQFNSSSLHSYSNNDTSSSIKYHQLDHLFYKNHRLDISNRFGDADYLSQNRSLYNKVNVISIPSNLYGNKIKQGSFYMTGSDYEIIDDSKGNLIISGTQLVSHSIDEREKVFDSGPIKGFKQYDINSSFYGKNYPNLPNYFSKNGVRDDSYYMNLLDYKNIDFEEKVIGPNLILNEDFADTSAWVMYPSVGTSTITGDKLVFANAQQFHYARQSGLSIGLNKTYRLTFTVSDLTEGSVSAVLVATSGESTTRPSRTTNGTYTEDVTMPGAGSSVTGGQHDALWFSPATPGTNSFKIDNVSLVETTTSPTTIFRKNSSISSSITSIHNETYNFNTDDDFTISTYIQPEDSNGHIIGKSTTQTTIQSPTYLTTNTTGSSQVFNVKSKNQFPFEVYVDSSQNLTFRRSDGTYTPTITTPIDTGSLSHVVCMKSGSQLSIHIDGVETVTGTDTTVKQTQNQANLYIGSKGEVSDFYSGSISNLMVFNQSRSQEQIKSLHTHPNGSPYIGNIFYSMGIATITNPKHQYIAQPGNGLFNVDFQSLHPVYENEYMCTVDSRDYNYTNNISTRKTKSDQSPLLANFATSSLFHPYVTTIGLYDEDNNLLVVGKLGQPVRMNDEADTTFVLRWDT